MHIVVCLRPSTSMFYWGKNLCVSEPALLKSMVFKVKCIMSRSVGLFNLSAIDLLYWIVSFVRYYPVHCRLFNKRIVLNTKITKNGVFF